LLSSEGLEVGGFFLDSSFFLVGDFLLLDADEAKISEKQKIKVLRYAGTLVTSLE